ncbi:MAG: TrkH family potassium uptake protein [Methanocella sp.]
MFNRKMLPTASSISSGLERLDNNRLVSFKNLRVILSNLTGLFTVTTILMLAMTVICILLSEPENAPGFAAAFIVSGGLAIAFKGIFPRAEELELRHAMVVAALAYLFVPALSAIPFIIIQHMSPLDAFFEGISGWTGSGFTMIPYPEYSSHAIQLWRSVIQWVGGIGVILLMVAILIRPGTSTYIMYQSEARKEKIKPSIRSTINMIWSLYVGLTVLGVALLVVVGMPLWDSINHSMTTLGTGGLSIYSDSIAHYHSVPIEIVIMFIMILGALPFAFIYKTVAHPKSLLPLDPQVKAFFIFIILGVLLLTIELFLQQRDLLESIRISAFQLISGITCTGLQSTDMTGWSQAALLITSVFMIIGGCAGSTAGGIKVARAVFLTSELQLWLKRTLLPRNAILMLKMGNKRLNEEVINKELAEASLISFLWVTTILVSVILLTHIVPTTYDLSHIIFMVCSALGNVGLWCGFLDPGFDPAGKIIIIIDMWIGRLEIIPVTLLIRSLIKGFKV